jgi:quercetin dioxygenase-like cupin family protein
MQHSLVGWDIVHGAAAEWIPWGGEHAPARAKILGTGDGYFLVLVEAAAGYVGGAHDHAYAEMAYVLSGTIENQGVPMGAGDGYVASAGSSHTGFTATSDATYIVAFKA